MLTIQKEKYKMWMIVVGSLIKAMTKVFGFRFLDESLGDIFVRLYGCIGIDCILRYIITMALLFTI